MIEGLRELAIALSAPVFVALAAWFIRFLVQSAVKQKFDEGLEDFKRKQAEQLESYKRQESQKLESYKHELVQQLEVHKIELKAQYDAELARLGSDLRRESFQHETRFAHLHARRAETITATFGLIRRLHSLTLRYISPIGFEGQPSFVDRRKDVHDALKDFDDYYLPREILLPSRIAATIDQFRDNHFDVIMNFKEGVELRHDDRSGGRPWSDSINAMKNNVTPVLDALMTEIRNLLDGDTEDVPAARRMPASDSL